MKSPIFIIGGSRTGSELHRKLLMKYSNLDLISEVWFLSPRWLHKDFSVMFKQTIGSYSHTELPEKLVELFYSKMLFGSFWQNRIDDELNKEMMLDAFKQNRPKELKEVLKVLLVEHARQLGKDRPGAKFPVHYSYAPLLLEWFEDCQLIHTMRDPRAVLYSQTNKYTDLNYSKIQNNWIRFQQFIHITIQTRWCAKIHKKLKNNPRYMLSKYEDFIADTDLHIVKLCDFLKIELNPSMLSPDIESGSSFEEYKKDSAGFYSASVNKWRNEKDDYYLKLLTLMNSDILNEFSYK